MVVMMSTTLMMMMSNLKFVVNLKPPITYVQKSQIIAPIK